MPCSILHGTLQHDFVHGLFLNDIPMHGAFRPKHLFHNRNVARVMEPFIDIVSDEIEKCGQLGIAVFSGEFVVSVCETVQE